MIIGNIKAFLLGQGVLNCGHSVFLLQFSLFFRNIVPEIRKTLYEYSQKNILYIVVDIASIGNVTE